MSLLNGIVRETPSGHGHRTIRILSQQFATQEEAVALVKQALVAADVEGRMVELPSTVSGALAAYIRRVETSLRCAEAREKTLETELEARTTFFQKRAEELAEVNKELREHIKHLEAQHDLDLGVVAAAKNSWKSAAQQAECKLTELERRTKTVDRAWGMLAELYNAIGAGLEEFTKNSV